MAKIQQINPRTILDSRGNPTIEVDIVLNDGESGTASAPSGASTGKSEAHELRDLDKNHFHGKGVNKAIANIQNEIAPALIGMNADDQQAIDECLISLDGTQNKSRLGANSILAISLANAIANAKSKKTSLFKLISHNENYSLPVPMLNIINGGKHAKNSTDIQEFMIIPAGFDTFFDALKSGSEIFHHLSILLSEKKLNTSVGDEGGFAPSLSSNEQALELILQAIELASYQPGQQVFIGIDSAASEIYDNQSFKYNFNNENKILSSENLIQLYKKWVQNYPLISIEDGIEEDSWDDWNKLNSQIGENCQLVGDDLFTTNPNRIERGIKEKSANSVLIKPNQIGTLTETLNAIKIAKSVNWGTVISHRSGETESSFISDLAVATNAGQIKSGAPSRGERTAKYNQLIRIEQQLGQKAIFSGTTIFEKFIK